MRLGNRSVSHTYNRLLNSVHQWLIRSNQISNNYIGQAKSALLHCFHLSCLASSCSLEYRTLATNNELKPTYTDRKAEMLTSSMLHVCSSGCKLHHQDGNVAAHSDAHPNLTNCGRACNGNYAIMYCGITHQRQPMWLQPDQIATVAVVEGIELTRCGMAAASTPNLDIEPQFLLACCIMFRNGGGIQGLAGTSRFLSNTAPPAHTGSGFRFSQASRQFHYKH